MEKLDAEVRVEINYTLPPVSIDKEDLQWLWDETVKLFNRESETYDPEVQPKVTAKSGRWPKENTVEESEMTDLLKSGFVGDVLDVVEIRVRAAYFPKGVVGRRFGPEFTRHLTLTVDSSKATEVRMEGEVEWIHLARGVMDGFLSSRASENRRLRYLAFGTWMGLLEGAIVVAALRYQSGPLIVAAIFWPILGWIPLWLLAERLYPLSRIVISPAGMRLPWYIRSAKDLFWALLAALVAALILAALLPA